jgi:glycerol-3-phosphate dehydrogenase (NAD(P)+)
LVAQIATSGYNVVTFHPGQCFYKLERSDTLSGRVTVVGTGNWGTTLAIILARHGLEVTLWARTEEEARDLITRRANEVFLPGVQFPDNLVVGHSLPVALEACDLLLLVVPAQRMRENVLRVRGYLQERTIVVSAAKGLEIETTLRMTEVLKEELPPRFHSRLAVLSGPNLAREIIAGLPATTVVASENDEAACFVQSLITTPQFRVYTHSDVIGVELAGALKNIIALGAGISDGLGYGDNAKAAFMTRGLAEIARLGVAAGANLLTFAGLAGIGDLVTTCASSHSRNHYVGEQLAQGRSLAEIQASMRMVAEGVPTTIAALQLARRYTIEMPITEQMYQVLFEGKDPRRAVIDLMTRDVKGELDGLEPGVRALLEWMTDSLPRKPAGRGKE